MDKTYEVNSIEVKKVKVGEVLKSVADTELLDETGALIKGVGIWEDFPDFEKITFGSKIVGNIYEKGKYKTLYPPKAPKTGGNANWKEKTIEKAIVRKEASITAFQANKEESIKLAGAQRDAVLLTTTMLTAYNQVLSEAEVKDKIAEWMNWLLNKLPSRLEPF